MLNVPDWTPGRFIRCRSAEEYAACRQPLPDRCGWNPDRMQAGVFHPRWMWVSLHPPARSGQRLAVIWQDIAEGFPMKNYPELFMNPKRASKITWMRRQLKCKAISRAGVRIHDRPTYPSTQKITASANNCIASSGLKHSFSIFEWISPL